MALQYFGADQPVFSSFDRSPRNFVISLFILLLALPLLTWILNSISGLKEAVVERFTVSKRRTSMADPLEVGYERSDTFASLEKTSV